MLSINILSRVIIAFELVVKIVVIDHYFLWYCSSDLGNILRLGTFAKVIT